MDLPSGLPLECWDRVFNFAGPLSLLACASVCRDWCEMARAERHWEKHAGRVMQKLGLRYHSWSRPTWRWYTQVLLQEQREWSVGDISTHLKIASLCAIPSYWKLVVWSLTIVDGELGVNLYVRGDTRVMVTFQVGSTTGAVLTHPRMPNGAPGGWGCLLRSEGATWQRFHSIVRDSDCLGPRDEWAWLTIIQ